MVSCQGLPHLNLCFGAYWSQGAIMNTASNHEACGRKAEAGLHTQLWRGSWPLKQPAYASRWRTWGANANSLGCDLKKGWWTSLFPMESCFIQCHQLMTFSSYQSTLNYCCQSRPATTHQWLPKALQAVWVCHCAMVQMAQPLQQILACFVSCSFHAGGANKAKYTESDAMPTTY